MNESDQFTTSSAMCPMVYWGYWPPFTTETDNVVRLRFNCTL